MQFIILVLDKIIWPIVIIVFLALLRKPLSLLIPAAKKIKYKELEIDFAKNLEVVKKEAKEAFPEIETDCKYRLMSLAINMPNASILEVWEKVDVAATALVKMHCPDINLAIDTRYKLIEDLLTEKVLIETKKAKLFKELRVLRNKVAHAKGYDVDKTQAIQYIELCFCLIDYFNKLNEV